MEIGDPQRTVTVEPLEEPVRRERPAEQPARQGPGEAPPAPSEPETVPA